MQSYKADGRVLKLRAMDRDLQEKLDRMSPSESDGPHDNIKHRSFKSLDKPKPLQRSYDGATNGNKPRPPGENSQPHNSYNHFNRDRPPPLERDDRRPPPLERDDCHPPPLELSPRNVSPPARSWPRMPNDRGPPLLERSSYLQPRLSENRRSHLLELSSQSQPRAAENQDLHAPSSYKHEYCERTLVPAGYAKVPYKHEPHVEAYNRPRAAPVDRHRTKSPATVDEYRRPSASEHIRYRNPPNNDYREQEYSNPEYQDSGYRRSGDSRYGVNSGLLKPGFSDRDDYRDTPVRVSPLPQNFPDFSISKSSEDDSPKEAVVICVANFPFYTSEDQLFELFEDFSPIDVDMVENEPTGNRDDFTYALVTLPSLEQAEAATFELDNTLFHRRPIVVQLLCGDDISFEGTNDQSGSSDSITRTATPTKVFPRERQTLCERFSHMTVASGRDLQE